MVKMLGYYGSAPVGLIEDNVKRDEDGMEVMGVDFGGEDGGDEEEESVGGNGGMTRGETTTSTSTRLVGHLGCLSPRLRRRRQWVPRWIC